MQMRFAIEFMPLEAAHFPMLWEWHHRPHVAPWFLPWMPPTQEETLSEWHAVVEGRRPQRGYLVVVNGSQVGYIEGYRLSDDPEVAAQLALDRDAVGADVMIAEENLTGRGLGPQVVASFYLRMMDETGLDLGVIDPEVHNARAIRAYEKAGFAFLRVVDDEHSKDHIMLATRESIEAALGQLAR